ncbi:MAG: hypothetical protein U9R47_11250, partial [Actinomycetota bacterium]|nr:hypothetical protein [Actinomycetota bacterium]
VQPVGESWGAFVGTLRGEIWGPDLVQWFVGSVVILIAAALTVRKSRRSRLFPPIALIALGLGLITWGALSEFGVRNGAILVYGLAWLLGVIVADWSGRSSDHGAWRLAAVALVGGFVWLNLAGLSFANERVIPRTPSWDAPGVQRAADWLSENARGMTAAGTPVFLNYLSFRTSGAFDARLVPIFETDRNETPLPLSAFDRRVWWAAHIAQSPIGTTELGRTYGSKFISSITEEDLLEELWGSRAELVIVTGTAQSPGPYEGVTLVPYMEAIPWAERVYTSAVSELPYWIFIYRITDDPTPMHSPPATTYVPHPSRPYESLDRLTITGRDDYEDFIETIVRADS